MSRSNLLLFVFLVALVAIVVAECPGNYGSCIEQAPDGCCRCGTPSSGWASSGCNAGSHDGYCVVSSTSPDAQVNCDAPCTIDSCNCGTFTLDSVNAEINPETGGNIYLVNWRVCNLCSAAVDTINIGASVGFTETQVALFSTNVVPFDDSNWGWRQVTQEFRNGAVRFTRQPQNGGKGLFNNGACGIFTVATTDQAVLLESTSWLANMYLAGGSTEKSLDCTGGQGQVKTGCLGAAALNFKTCCDKSVILATEACPAGKEPSQCKICRGACYDGGVEVIAATDSCTGCKSCNCGPDVALDEACPVCCLNANGIYGVAASEADCFTRCCDYGDLRQGTFQSECVDKQVGCELCPCDGRTYDADQGYCKCCEDEQGIVRNVAFTGSNGIPLQGFPGADVGGDFCYYCRDLCESGQSIDDCIAAGNAVTVRFTVTESPGGDFITIRATYSTNFVDNHWGPGSGADWGWEAERKWSQVLGSDKIDVQMIDAAGNVVMDFNVDLIAGYGSSIAEDYPSGYKSGCVAFKPAGVSKADGKMVAGDENWFIGCTTSTEVACNSECGLSIDACVEGNPSPSQELREGDGPCGGDGWDDVLWYEWTVRSSPFAPGGGFGYPVIYNIHASPSKSTLAGDNCVVVGEIPSPCASLGVESDTGDCWETCLCEIVDGSPVRRQVDDVPCGECCCVGTLPTAPPAGTSCGDFFCCPANPFDVSLVNAPEDCPKKCCTGEWVQAGASCPFCCPGSTTACELLNGVCDIDKCAGIVRCCDNSIAPNGDASKCPVCCPSCCPANVQPDNDPSGLCKQRILTADGATEEDCPACCCPESTVSPCLAPLISVNGECPCLDGDSSYACATVSCCEGEAVDVSSCPFCCPDDGGYFCAESGEVEPLSDLSSCDADVSGAFNGDRSAGSTRAYRLEACQPDVQVQPQVCCDGVTYVFDLSACPSCLEPCCDNVIRPASDCPSCVETKVCPGTSIEVPVSQECPINCCPNQEAVWELAADCPVCCPTGPQYDINNLNECPVQCCDGSIEATQDDCPWCCPGVSGLIVPRDQCGDVCNDDDCDACPDATCSSSSCSPCGETCECTCRSPAIPYCCPDGGGLYSPCTNANVEGVIGAAQDYKTEAGCQLNCTCGYVDPTCLVVDSQQPPGCSANPDCESCRADEACEWCPELGRCTSTCTSGGDILCGAEVVETNQPTCYKDCYGNGDCVTNAEATCTGNSTECEGTGTCNPNDPEQECLNQLCECYQFGYINQDNVYCAPKAASNDADKVGIIVGSAGAAGIVLLLCVAAGMLVIGGKAAYDFATAGDYANAEMHENPTFIDPGRELSSAIHELKG